MRKWILLGTILLLSGCASTDSDGKTQVPFPLREAFSGMKPGPWTPEFPPE